MRPRVFAYLNYAAGLVAVLAYAASGGFVLFKIGFESNHIGFSLFDTVPFILFLAFTGVSNIIFPLHNRRLGLLILTLSALALGCVLIFDRYNILVEYHEWIRRGMPGKPWE